MHQLMANSAGPPPGHRAMFKIHIWKGYLSSICIYRQYSHSNMAVKPLGSWPECEFGTSKRSQLNSWGVLFKVVRTSFEYSKRGEVLQAEFLINLLSFRGYCLVLKLALGLLKAAVVMCFAIAFTVSKWQLDSHSTAFIHDNFEKINLSLILFLCQGSKHLHSQLPSQGLHSHIYSNFSNKFKSCWQVGKIYTFIICVVEFIGDLYSECFL